MKPSVSTLPKSLWLPLLVFHLLDVFAQKPPGILDDQMPYINIHPFDLNKFQPEYGFDPFLDINNLSSPFSNLFFEMPLIGGFYNIHKNNNAIKRSLSEKNNLRNIQNNATFKYWQRGNYQKAIAEIKNQLQHIKKRNQNTVPAKVRAWLHLAFVYNESGKLSTALKWSEKAQPLLIGTHSSHLAGNLCNIATLYINSRKYKKASDFFDQSTTLFETCQNPDKASLAILNNNKANWELLQGNFIRANGFLKKSMHFLDTDQRDHAALRTVIFHNQALLALVTGKLDDSLNFIRACLDLRKSTFGNGHPLYLRALISYSEILRKTGDRNQAEGILAAATANLADSLGNGNLFTAFALSIKATQYRQAGNNEKEAELLESSLKIKRKYLGLKHPVYRWEQTQRALLLTAMGRYDDARNTIKMHKSKKFLGKNHPVFGWMMLNIARTHQSLGLDSHALEEFSKGMKIWRASMGDHNLFAATNAISLARLLSKHQKKGAAQKEFHTAMASLWILINKTIPAQSERQQRQLTQGTRYALDAYLSAALDLGLKPDDTYCYVYFWKGAILAAQRRAATMRQHPEWKFQLQKLQEISVKIKMQILTKPTNEAYDTWKVKLEQLNKQKEQLERLLFQNSHGTSNSLPGLSLDQIKSALPENGVLIDFYKYRYYGHSQSMGSYERRKATTMEKMTAFVVSHNQPVERIELGSARDIEDAIYTWRNTFSTQLSSRGLQPRTSRYSTSKSELGTRVKALIWDPLRIYLDRLPWESTRPPTVLLSPDGAIQQIPIGALPAQKPGQFLLEHFAFSLLPTPHLLSESISKKPESKFNSESASILLIGGANYTKEEDLPYSQDEIEKIAGLFRQFNCCNILKLSGKHANIEGFLRHVQDAKFIHLAIHGFFPIPKSLLHRNADLGHLRKNYPRLLSALVFSGNQNNDSGIFTANELITLNLSSTELLVFSACETGLGVQETGEGLLGLMRAALVAGSDAVLASLWRVPDKGTQEFMGHFYQNLWGKKLPKIEALRLAQLTMIKRNKPITAWAGWILAESYHPPNPP